MKESGIGRENGVEAFEACECRALFLAVWGTRPSLPLMVPFCADSQSKSTIVNIASSEETRTSQDWFAEEDETEKRYG